VSSVDVPFIICNARILDHKIYLDRLDSIQGELHRIFRCLVSGVSVILAPSVGFKILMDLDLAI
jgi:hypothetical protein